MRYETVCIDLAGFDITAGASKTTPFRAIESSGVLTILDTAETDGVISGGYMYGAPSSEVSIYGGNILVTGASAVMNLYGGTVADGYMNAGNYKYHIYGGNIGVLEGATLNVKGGAITGGQVVMGQQATAYHGGGNIYAKASTVNISDGVVSDGLVKAHYSSSSSANRKAYGVGGNIVANGGALTISGGVISGGSVDVKCTATCTTATPSATAEGLGGNINASSGAQVTITGGTISGGSVTALPVANNGGSTAMEAFGGNIYVTGTGTVLNMSGGTVSGGFARYRGGNMAVSNQDG